MADDQISVELLAKVDGLTSGLTEAVNAIRSAVEAIKGDVHELDETAKESEGTLQKILGGEYFMIFKEVATEALEAVKEGFENTIVKAEEFGLSNAKFAVMMGTSETEAAGLSAALRGVGSSSEAYEGMALKLEMRLKTMEPAMNKLGITTRDASGQLLGGKELMDNAISTMGTYKAGTDQNSFALEVFGRKAADVYDIMRVGDEQVNRQIDIYKEFGVKLDDTAGASAEVEDVLNDVKTMFEAMGLAVGQQVMPIVKDFAGVFETVLLPVFSATVETVKFVSVTFMSMGAIVDNVATVIKGVFIEIFDVLKGIGAQIYDALHGNWSAMKDDAAATWGEMKTDAKSAASDIVEQWGTVQDFTNKLYGANEEAPKKNPYKQSGGTRGFKAPGKKGPADHSAEDEIKDAEKLALEQVSLEESTNQHLLSMGQESVEAFVAQERALEDQKYSIQMQALNEELAIPGRKKAEIIKTYDEIAIASQSHEDALVRISQDAESRRAAISKEQLANALRADDERLESARADLQEQANLGQITLTERDAQEIALTQTIRREQLARLDAELAGLTPRTKAYEDVIKQREHLEKQFTGDLKAENAQRARDIEANVKTWLTPLTSGFKTAISDMVLHGKSFADSIKAMGDSILQGFLDMILQMGEHWVILQITNAEVAKATTADAAISQISSNAGVAGSAAAASQAGIPIVGPALAAAAAAGMIALVLGYEGLAHASGGMVLDRDRLVYAHKEEMILPANLSQGVQRMIAGGGGGGGDINLHYNPQVTGGSKDLAALIREQPGALRAAITQLSRDGAFRPRIV